MTSRDRPVHLPSARRMLAAGTTAVMGWRGAAAEQPPRSTVSGGARMSGAIEGPRVSAVTGTNGKTSVATATLQLMRAAGWSAAGIDSLGITDVGGSRRGSGSPRTTCQG